MPGLFSPQAADGLRVDALTGRISLRDIVNPWSATDNCAGCALAVDALLRGEAPALTDDVAREVTTWAQLDAALGVGSGEVLPATLTQAIRAIRPEERAVAFVGDGARWHAFNIARVNGCGYIFDGQMGIITGAPESYLRAVGYQHLDRILLAITGPGVALPQAARRALAGYASQGVGLS